MFVVLKKNLRDDDYDDAEDEDVYFGDQHSGGGGGDGGGGEGGLNVERLTTVRNITGGCRMEKKNKLCAKNETSL